MTEQRIRLGTLEYGAIIAAAVSTCSAIYSAGVLRGDVNQLSNRVEMVEIAVRSQQATASSLDNRLARIEGNLEFLVARYQTDDRERRGMNGKQR